MDFPLIIKTLEAAAGLVDQPHSVAADGLCTFLTLLQAHWFMLARWLPSSRLLICAHLGRKGSHQHVERSFLRKTALVKVTLSS